MLDRRHFLAVLTSASLPLLRGPRGFAQTAGSAARRWSRVQDVLDAHVRRRTIAGAVAALSYGDAPVAYLAAGGIALDSDQRADEHSIYRMFSTTKVVTGIAAMRLIQDGKLRLDQPVAELLPEWKSLRVAVDPQKSLQARPARTIMTMRHLLTHTSGLAYWIPAAGSDLLPSTYRERGITPGDYGIRGARPGYGPQVKSLSEMIARLAELPLASDPGTVYQYSVGYDVMGLIIERVSGMSLDAYFREHICEPLKMTSSGFQVPASQAARLTTNYEASADGLTLIDGGESSVWLRPPALVAGGGGLVSTARDFARFTGMLLGQGTFEGVQVLHNDIARLACSNLLPAQVVSDSGFGCRNANHQAPQGAIMAGAGSGRHSELWRRGRLPVDGRSRASRRNGLHDAAHAGFGELASLDELHAAVDADIG